MGESVDCYAKIWQTIVHDSGHNFDDIQIIDTVPIPVCHPRRASARQIFCDDILGTTDHDYCASKDWHYFGFKGGIRISVTGMIVKAPLLDARAHDISSLDALLNGVPAQTTILGNKGFIDEQQQQRKDKEYRILIKTPLRSNMGDRPRFRFTQLEQRVRGLVETVIGQLTECFSIQDMKVRTG